MGLWRHAWATGQGATLSLFEVQTWESCDRLVVLGPRQSRVLQKIIRARGFNNIELKVKKEIKKCFQANRELSAKNSNSCLQRILIAAMEWISGQ